jgi:pimeloyl-ACP methyl ester carboxylesterase
MDGLQESFEAVGVQGTPVTALFGADDELIPLEAATILQAAMPKAEVQIIDDQGHDLALDSPELVLDALQALMARTSETAE